MGRGGGRVSGAKRTQLASGNTIEIALTPTRRLAISRLVRAHTIQIPWTRDS
jgi:hypothetical protein